jgi:putative ABC transport system substrate-binding protein
LARFSTAPPRLATNRRAAVHVFLIYPYREYIELGGLMAYAPDLDELAQRLASDVHQILGGTKPGDLPFYEPNKFELIVNVKAVRALLHEVPPALLACADKVIE